jgi:hypothetical protein
MLPILGAQSAKAPWKQRIIGERAAWGGRDGATLFALNSGRLILAGGWSTYDFDGETTNQVWASDDGGATWGATPICPHSVPNPSTLFPRVHTPAHTAHAGYYYLIGGDGQFPHSEVWRTSLSGNGATWEKVTNFIHADWEDRILSVAGSLDGKLYLMGGQLNYTDKTSARADVYVSTDDGATWTKMGAAIPWSARGMVAGMPVIDGCLYLVGGGRYENDGAKDCYDGVFKFDGTTWTTVLAEGHNTWRAGGRAYHNVVSAGGRLWVITGSTSTAGGSNPIILFSEDKGVSWSEFDRCEWGRDVGGSHADGVTVVGERIYRASGNAFDRETFILERRSGPPAPTIESLSPTSGSSAGGDLVTVTGKNFSHGVWTVGIRSAPGSSPILYRDATVVSDTELTFVTPARPAASIYPLVVGPAGTGLTEGVAFLFV